MSRTGWEDILDKDERIVWQGRPDGKVVFRIRNIFVFIFGLFFAGFAMFWMVMAASAGGFFWMFGLLHFSVGLGISLGAIFFSAFKRRRTWYTLTTRRAFIASNLPFAGRRLRSYPIDADTVLELDDGDPPSIFFATEMRQGKNSSYTARIGFERIDDGRKVYQKFRDVQEAAQ